MVRRHLDLLVLLIKRATVTNQLISRTRLNVGPQRALLRRQNVINNCTQHPPRDAKCDAVEAFGGRSLDSLSTSTRASRTEARHCSNYEPKALLYQKAEAALGLFNYEAGLSFKKMNKEDLYSRLDACPVLKGRVYYP